MMPLLTKTQRNQILLIAVGTAIAVILLWLFLVQSLNKSLARDRQNITAAQEKVDRATGLIRKAPQIQQELEAKAAHLKEIEDGMASGDLYSWIILTLNKFKAPYQVSIPNYSPAQLGEVGLLPSFPYPAAVFSINGTAFYHDLGRFICDFENSFPYMRVQNLEVRPAAGAAVDTPEKLDFKLEIVALVKSTAAK